MVCSLKYISWVRDDYECPSSKFKGLQSLIDKIHKYALAFQFLIKLPFRVRHPLYSCKMKKCSASNSGMPLLKKYLFTS